MTTKDHKLLKPSRRRNTKLETTLLEKVKKDSSSTSFLMGRQLLLRFLVKVKRQKKSNNTPVETTLVN
jgi:hypothetical protein